MTDADEDLVSHLMGVGETSAREYFDHVTRDLPRRKQRRDKFREDLASEWAHGWLLYEAVNSAMQEAALILLERCEATKGNPDERLHVREALLLIHSNACLLLQEIHALLRAGFWAGGAARWRALHELSVTAYLMSSGGSAIAERYLDHAEVVHARRLAGASTRYGTGPLDRTQLQQRLDRADKLCQKHDMPGAGYRFYAAYGWALPLMPLEKSGKLARPTFDKLEALAGQSDWRELVSTAHGLVHADSAGVVAAVIAGQGEYMLGPSPLFISTVARPTMLCVSRLAAATCIGFESGNNDFTERIHPVGATVMALAGLAADAFPLSESPEHLAAGARPSGSSDAWKNK